MASGQVKQGNNPYYDYTIGASADDPVVKPELIDGKWMKYCECGCGKFFEVQPRSRGRTRYTPKCSKRIAKARQNRRNKKAL